MKKALKETLKMYQIDGWKLKNDFKTHLEIEKQSDTGLGHLVVLLLTFWTFGIGNLIYHLISYKKKKIFD